MVQIFVKFKNSKIVLNVVLVKIKNKLNDYHYVKCARACDSLMESIMRALIASLALSTAN